MTPCKWEDSVRIHERKDAGVRRLEDLRIRSKDRCKWGLLCHSHPFEGIPRSRRQLRLHLYPAVCWILRVVSNKFCIELDSCNLHSSQVPFHLFGNWPTVKQIKET